MNLIKKESQIYSIQTPDVLLNIYMLWLFEKKNYNNSFFFISVGSITSNDITENFIKIISI